ncbi:MAG: hypothetical protein C0508_29430 [Cyanobacteria bacterium PR.023]|nr:hypothetical protein [Cyanobacteria bacterium PR.023]
MSISTDKVILWQALLLLTGIALQEWYICSPLFLGSDMILWPPLYLGLFSVVIPAVLMFKKKEGRSQWLCLMVISPYLFFSMANHMTEFSHDWKAENLFGPARLQKLVY